MKNRTDEYWELVGELSDPPKKLEGTVERARKRVRRARFLHKLAAPAATLAAAAACFVLLVNTVPTFALACSGVPGLRQLTAAVAFSPSLSAAVAHDYVQYIGQSQTVDGVTVRLECAIVDEAQAVFFYSADGGRFYTSPRLADEAGQPIGGYAVSTTGQPGETAVGGLDSMTLSFVDSALPERFTLELFFMALPERAEASRSAPTEPGAGALDGEEDPRHAPGVLCFTFDVTLDPSRISRAKTVEVGRWVELDGQRILVDSLEILPTRTILHLGEDPDNTAWLRTLKFWFEDEQGRRYDETDGSLSASGETGSKSYLTYYFRSFYYDQPQGLTLCVSKAEWLDKDAPHVYLDLTTGACTGLPEGVWVDEVKRTGDLVEVKLLSTLERETFGATFQNGYWDPEGNQHSFTQWSGGKELDDDTNQQLGTYEKLYLEDYPWDTVELELGYTSMSAWEQPVYVPMTPQR